MTDLHLLSSLSGKESWAHDHRCPCHAKDGTRFHILAQEEFMWADLTKFTPVQS